jgi:hypothetical protein
VYHFFLCRPILELRKEFLLEESRMIPLSEFNESECIDIRPVHKMEIPRLVEMFTTMGFDSTITLTVVVKPLVVNMGDESGDHSWEEEILRPFIIDGRHRICALKEMVFSHQKPLGYEGEMEDFPIPVRVLRADTPDECLVRLANGSC